MKSQSKLGGEEMNGLLILCSFLASIFILFCAVVFVIGSIAKYNVGDITGVSIYLGLAGISILIGIIIGGFAITNARLEAKK